MVSNENKTQASTPQSIATKYSPWKTKYKIIKCYLSIKMYVMVKNGQTPLMHSKSNSDKKNTRKKTKSAVMENTYYRVD